MFLKKSTTQKPAAVTEQIWDGVYPSLDEVPVRGKGFDGETWVHNSLKKIHALLELADAPGSISPAVAYSSSLLPLLAAIVSGATGRARILDFGGGLGMTYVAVSRALGNTQTVDYHIVETEAVCDAGRGVFADDPNVYFHATLPATPSTFDIVHLGSSLHYVDRWRDLLGDLARSLPRYFLFTDLNAGDIPTYATAQRYYESTIPAWFFNVGEVIGRMEQLGYRMTFRSQFIDSIRNAETRRPQENFPEALRLDRACSLLFSNSHRAPPEGS